MDQDTYRSYTHGLRHPVTIGQVGGWRLPWALSLPQLGAAGTTAGFLLATRGLWAHLGGPANLLVFCVAVIVAAWAVGHLRIEGRSPLRVAAGWLTVLCSPACRRGIRNGVPVRPPRAHRSRGRRIAVAEPIEPLETARG